MLDLSKIDFLADHANTSVTRPVGGKPKEFWPLSPRHFGLFRATAGKLAGAVRDMLYDYKSEGGVQRESNVQEKVGSRLSTETALPINPVLSEQHRKFRLDAVERVFNALDDDTLNKIGLCILDSMRDDFPREEAKPFTLKDGEQLVASMSLPIFIQCAMGVFAANMDSFGPFAKRAAAKVAESLNLTSLTPTPSGAASSGLSPEGSPSPGC